MQITTIQAEPRTRQSRQGLARLRRRGMVPAIIYGLDKPPEMVALSAHDLEQALEHMQHVLQLRINGQTTSDQYLLKQVQYDTYQKHIIHADLLRVDPERRVTVNVPVEPRGEPKGMHEGGVVVHLLTEIEVECRPADIPEVLRPKIDHLGLNEGLHVRDIELPPGVTAVSEPDELVVIVQPKRGVEVEEEEEAEAAEAAGAEPEVIGRGKEAEESDASEG